MERKKEEVKRNKVDEKGDVRQEGREKNDAMGETRRREQAREGNKRNQTKRGEDK